LFFRKFDLVSDLFYPMFTPSLLLAFIFNEFPYANYKIPTLL